SVMKTAGEGGAWGMAVLASYMVNKAEGETLEDYLNNKVFAGQNGTIMEPDAADVAGFDKYIESYKALLATEEKAVEGLPLN
ncbi:MAG: ATPase, partial [Agathobacter sp.]